MYREEETSTFTHNGKEYSVNWLLEKTQHAIVHAMPTTALAWALHDARLNPARVNRADLSAPIIYTIDPVYGYVILDGSHRLMKAMKGGIEALPAVLAPIELFTEDK